MEAPEDLNVVGVDLGGEEGENVPGEGEEGQIGELNIATDPADSVNTHRSPCADESLSVSLPPLPSNLREISSLASWTVSSSKPGCSVPQLRSPSIHQFWQSDGPQPHLLNIHFFKLVSIVGMRLYLDFEADESYTPTRIQFLAGTGEMDLQEWAEMRLEQPKGWIDVDFGGVGRRESREDFIGFYSENDDLDLGSNSEYDSTSQDSEGAPKDKEANSQVRKNYNRRLPILRAFLVQIRILENHQNGKDTHLRGVQIFARDKPKAEHTFQRDDRAMESSKHDAKRRRQKSTLPFRDAIPDLR